MPLCPQITITPVTVTTSGMTQSSVVAANTAATTEQLSAVDADAAAALAAALAAQADAAAAIADATAAQADAATAIADATAAQAAAAAAQADADQAYTQAVAANTAAGVAQTTANGKNKVTYSTAAPGSTANTVGDIWYQYGTTSPNVGRIIAQYSGAGGTSWTQTTISGLVVANIDAGNITTGTLTAAVGISNPSGNFSVNGATGALVCTGATVTGTIVATTGTFTGTVIATTGTFTGTVYATTGSFTGTVIATTGTFTGTVYATTGSFTGTVVATTGSFTGAIYASGGTIGGFTIQSTYLSGSGGFTLYSNGIIDGGLSNTIFYGYANIGGGPATGERFIVTGNSSFVGTAIFSGNTTSQTHFYSPFATNVTAAANGYWVSSSGRMTYTTASSQRYKHDIVDLTTISEYDPKKLLSLPVRAFRYNEGYVTPTDDRAEMLIPGFIAEEVDAVYPIACDYSETQGPESWNDRILLPAMLSLIQDLYKEINQLKGA